MINFPNKIQFQVATHKNHPRININFIQSLPTTLIQLIHNKLLKTLNFTVNLIKNAQHSLRSVRCDSEHTFLTNCTVIRSWRIERNVGH